MRARRIKSNKKIGFVLENIHGAPQSGRLVAAENIGAQVAAGDFVVGDMLESAPIFRSKQCLVVQPLGHGLLAQARAFHEAPESLGQRGLAAGDINRPLQSGNVRYIHDHRRYTTRVVLVNDLGCVPQNKDTCTVLYMPSVRKKPAPTVPPARVRKAEVDANGETLGDRLKRGMNIYARSNGKTDWKSFTQDEWVALASRAVGRNPETDAVMTQQNLSLILDNKTSKSDGVIAFGILLGLEAAWLQYSYGPPTIIERTSPSR